MRSDSGDLPLVAREHAVERLDALLDALRLGRPGRLAVTGVAGIGKTALLRELVGRARARGVRVASATAGEDAQAWPFGAVLDLLEPLAIDGAGPASAFAAARDGDGHARPEAEIRHSAAWVAESAAAEHPLLLVLDDAHLADDASLRTLEALATSLAAVPLGLVVAARPLARPPLDALLSLLELEPVAALDLDATTELLRRERPDVATGSAERVHAATGGVPLLVLEAARALGQRGLSDDRPAEGDADILPAPAARRVVARLLRAGEPARRLAQAVAVLDDHATLARATALAEGATDLDVLVAAGIVEDTTAPRIVHPLVRRTVLDDAGPARVASLHRAAAALLHAEGLDATAVARHLQASDPGGPSWVVATLRAAADRALARGAPATAADLLARALAEPQADDRASLLLRIAEAEGLAGRSTAEAHALAAVDHAADAEQRVEAWLAVARLRSANGAFADAARAAQAAGAAARDPGSQVDADAVLRRARLFLTPGLPGADAQPPIPPAPRLADERTALAAQALGATVAVALPRDRVRELVDAALDDGRLVEEEADPAVVSLCTGALLYVGDPEADVAVARAYAERSRRRGALVAVGAAAYLESEPLRQLGRLDEALDAARAAMDLADRESIWALGGRTVLARVLVDRDEDGAADLLEGVEAPASLGTIASVVVLTARAAVALAAGRPASARADAERALAAQGSAMRVPAPTLDARIPLAPALARDGEPQGAAEVAEALLADARAWGEPGLLAEALRVHAAAVEATALERLAEAVEVSRAAQAVLPRAEALLALGSALRRRRRRSDARAPLREALAVADRHDLARIGRLASEELAATGERVRRLGPRGSTLTPAERRVATLAAQGRSNREIAATLVVSLKTVEFHLGRCYRKLRIPGRDGLAAALDADQAR